MIILLYLLYVVLALELIAFLYNIRRDFATKPFTANGCNFFNNKTRYPCCFTHDKDYGHGGFFIARLKADIKMLTCLWKYNRVLAVTMFLAVRMGGMFNFQYGKRRPILLSDGTIEF